MWGEISGNYTRSPSPPQGASSNRRDPNRVCARVSDTVGYRFLVLTMDCGYVDITGGCLVSSTQYLGGNFTLATSFGSETVSK